MGLSSANARRSPLTVYCRAGKVTFRPLPPRRSQMGEGGQSNRLARDRWTVPLPRVRAIEVYYRGAWTSVADVSDEDFNRYLAERPAIYEAAYASVREKIAANP